MFKISTEEYVIESTDVTLKNNKPETLQGDSCAEQWSTLGQLLLFFYVLQIKCPDNINEKMQWHRQCLANCYSPSPPAWEVMARPENA